MELVFKIESMQSASSKQCKAIAAFCSRTQKPSSKGLKKIVMREVSSGEFRARNLFVAFRRKCMIFNCVNGVIAGDSFWCKILSPLVRLHEGDFLKKFNTNWIINSDLHSVSFEVVHKSMLFTPGRLYCQPIFSLGVKFRGPKNKLKPVLLDESKITANNLNSSKGQLRDRKCIVSIPYLSAYLNETRRTKAEKKLIIICSGNDTEFKCKRTRVFANQSRYKLTVCRSTVCKHLGCFGITT